MFLSISDERKALEQELTQHKGNLYKLREQAAIYAAGELPLYLRNQIEREEQKIESIEAKLQQLDKEIEAEAQKPRRKTPYWKYGCVAAVVFMVIVGGVLKTTGLLDRLLAQLRPPTFTPTPTKTPVTVSPTITGTPTLTSTPSPTSTPTPYYVEIVVDASERMGVEFEGSITKMETAWQTAGTIARTRALKGQFVGIRTFGSGGEQPDMGCFESYSVFSFTNQDSEIKACLTTRPIPCGQAAVVTALTDASANLMAHENIGREIILLTGGEDGCGSDLSVFYSSDNQALWTQTFVILFADEDFGPFINLRAQGANINYNLVRNRAEAETVAEKVANSPPPTPTPMPTPIPPPPSPAPVTEGEPQPAFTPKPPPPTPTRGSATSTRPPRPATTQPPAHTSTPTHTPTFTKTATNTPTTTPTKTPTPTQSPTPISTSEVTYNPGSRTITIHPGDAQAQTGRLCKGKMADVGRYAVFLRAAYLQGFGEPAGLLATVTHVYPAKGTNITLHDVEVGQYNDTEIDASGEQLNYSHCAFNAVQDMRNQLELPLELGGFNDSPRFDHGTITIQLSSTPDDGDSKDKSVTSSIFAASDQASMASRATDFRQAYKATAAINGTAFSPGSDDNTSIRIAYDRVVNTYSGDWALWGIVLPETDVSSLSKLAFDIRGQSGGEIPNVWLASRSTPEDIRNYVDIENYLTVTTNWQRVEIPLTDFHVMEGSEQTIDLTQIVRVEIAFEWEDMAGMVYVDGFAFEP